MGLLCYLVAPLVGGWGLGEPIKERCKPSPERRQKNLYLSYIFEVAEPSGNFCLEKANNETFCCLKS